MSDAPSASHPAAGLTDPSHLHARLEEACAAAAEQGVPLSLLVVGLDGVEGMSGGHGGDAGERVLAEVARAVASAVRTGDTAARMENTAARRGVEEFAVLLPGAGLVVAIAVGERVLNAVRDVSMPAEAAPARVTASAGLASTEEGVACAADLFARADAALLAARQAGGGRLAVTGMVLA